MILGGNAAISKNLIDLVIKDVKYSLTVVARSNHKTNKNVHYIDTDYFNLENYKEQLHKSDYLFYAIGITNGSDQEIEKINIQLFTTIAKELNTKTKIIFISSASMLFNDNTYANSKLAAEKILSETGNQFVSLRPTVMYGKYDQNNLIKMENIIKMLPIVPVIAPNNKIQPVAMKDIAQLAYRVIKNNSFTNTNYTTSGPRQIGMYEVFQLLAKKNKLNRPLIPIPLKPVQLLVRFLDLFIPSKYILTYQILNMKSHPPFDSSKAISELGYQQSNFETEIFKR